MNQEQKVADELQKMFRENIVPTSVQEDINEISQSLKNGKITLNELQTRDPFVVKYVQEAMNRIE